MWRGNGHWHGKGWRQWGKGYEGGARRRGTDGRRMPWGGGAGRYRAAEGWTDACANTQVGPPSWDEIDDLRRKLAELEKRIAFRTRIPDTETNG